MKPYSIINPPKPFYEVNDGISETIPEQTLSVRDIINMSLSGALSDDIFTSPCDDEVPEDTFAVGEYQRFKDLTDLDIGLKSTNPDLLDSPLDRIEIKSTTLNEEENRDRATNERSERGTRERSSDSENVAETNLQEI